MSKHTPAPWGDVVEMSEEFFMETNHKYAVQGGHCGVIAKVEGKGDVYKANAQLIAVAPDLLQHLEILVEEANAIDVDCDIQPIINGCRMLIKKAKGES